MEPVAISELMDIAEYERNRPEFRGKVMAEKERRRVGVGPVFTFLFENHLTVLYQVQEMMRVERIVKEDAIAQEVKTYNELLPAPGGLGVTLLIEYTDPAERALELARLVGIENHIWIRVGDLPPVQGRFDTRQMNSDKISSVQYMKFPLQPEHREEWAEAGRSGAIRLVVDHPHYRHETAIPADTASALGEDLGL